MRPDACINAPIAGLGALHSSRAPRQRHGSARKAPHHFVQGNLVLAHLARTRPRLFGHHSRFPVPVATTYIRVVALQPCQSTGVLEMPSITAHHLLGAPPSPPVPANTTRALVASPRCRPHAGAIAASTRPSNPVSGLLPSSGRRGCPVAPWSGSRGLGIEINEGREVATAVVSPACVWSGMPTPGHDEVRARRANRIARLLRAIRVIGFPP